MASGTIWGSFTGTATGNVRPAIEWSSTASTANNNSSVTATLVFMRYNTSWQSWNANGHNVTFTIDGNSATANRTFDIRGKTREVIWTRTRTVGHNSDGSKSISISASGNTGISLGSYNFSGTAVLDSIPRASTLNSFNIQSALQVSTANTVNLSISRASSSFTHDIQLRDGSTVLQSWNGQGLPTTLSVSAATVNTLLARMSTVTTRTLTLRVQTKSGSTNVGSAVTRNGTVTVHSNVVPTASQPSVSINGSGRDNSIGRYVQSISRATVSYTGNAVGGATVTSRRIIVRKSSNQANLMTITSASGTTGILSSNGEYEVIATTTDSRGRSTTSARRTFNVEAYSQPRITTFSAVRHSTTPTNVTIQRHGNHSPLGTLNPLQVHIERRQGDSGSYTAVPNAGLSNFTGTSFGASFTSTGNAVTSSYQFRMRLVDSFNNSAEATQTVSTETVVLDIHKNEGIGIGKIHEFGVLDVKGNARFQVEGAQDLFMVDALGTGGRDWFKWIRDDHNSGTSTVSVHHYAGGAGFHFEPGPGSDFGLGAMNNEFTITDNQRPDIGKLLTVHRDGQVDFSGVQTLNGTRVGQQLWSGGWHMNASQTVTPSRRLSQCPNGWVLLFGYFSGTHSDYNFNFTYIPKTYADEFSGQGMFAHNLVNGTHKYNASKYLYVSDTQIWGHASNADGYHGNQVLRRVYAW